MALAAAESGGTVEVWREGREGWDGTRSERVEKERDDGFGWGCEGCKQGVGRAVSKARGF
jgi:hypothetical protein